MEVRILLFHYVISIKRGGDSIILFLGEGRSDLKY